MGFFYFLIYRCFFILFVIRNQIIINLTLLPFLNFITFDAIKIPLDEKQIHQSN